MGASAWSYRVPYREDPSAALEALRERAFAERDYLWDAKGLPRPATLAELEQNPDPAIWEEGLHSILDVHEVVAADTDPNALEAYNAVRPVTAAELAALGLSRPTADDIPTLDTLIRGGHGRCAVLHDGDGRPAELYFFGATGD